MGQVMCGRYEVGQCIGEGGMAWVYLARDRRLERLVVLKVLRDDRRDDAELRERFAREARSAAGLAHPNVLTVFDVDAHEGTPFIVLEHHAARDLAVVLRERGRIEPRRAVRMAIDVLDALECAHARGLIHRDLKPHNLLVTDRGEIKITDFGLAKAERSDSLTRTHGMVGTPRYMSPEQAQGQEIGPQTDLYALGVVLYEMLCGKPPFDGDNPVTIGLKHVQEPPAPLSSHGVDASPVLEEVVMTALR
ncbi:MAG: serine/threonine protein kinase, partial [Proteobacteria bacterium]|nr:serine/threonine protein kinase [Pseudomonadota bacterium]